MTTITERTNRKKPGPSLHKAIPATQNRLRIKSGDRIEVTLAGFNAGETESFIVKASKNEYRLLKRTKLEDGYNDYLLFGFQDGIYFNETYTRLKAARDRIKVLVFAFTKKPEEPAPRLRLFRIQMGTRGNMKSKDFYRDVAHYKQENLSIAKNTLLQRSKAEEDWVYEDTRTQL